MHSSLIVSIFAVISTLQHPVDGSQSSAPSNVVDSTIQVINGIDLQDQVDPADLGEGEDDEQLISRLDD